jgi:hypothetical protein
MGHTSSSVLSTGRNMAIFSFDSEETIEKFLLQNGIEP